MRRTTGFLDDTPLVRLAEAAVAVWRCRSRRGNMPRRRRHNLLTSHMTRHMTMLSAAAVKPLARRGRLFMSKLGAPVPEPLQRQPVQLAIFALIQSTTPPAVQMRAPEHLQFQALPSCHSRHDRPSRLTKMAVERKVASRLAATSVSSLNAYLIRRMNSLFCSSNSLLRALGKLPVTI